MNYTPAADGLVKAWDSGIEIQPEAWQQLRNVAALPFVGPHVAVMPDAHWGNGACVGSVIPTQHAIIPAAVGVDIGCGMMALRTNLVAGHLPDNLRDLRLAIEEAVPVGFNMHEAPPSHASNMWRNAFSRTYDQMIERHPAIEPKTSTAPLRQLGTLGGGNHFIEVCIDERDYVWVMLHSGSRGIGNRIGQYFIERAKESIAKQNIKLVDQNLAWLDDSTPEFSEYVTWLNWAQRYACENRNLMMQAVLRTLSGAFPTLDIDYSDFAVNCHHNYVASETHFGHQLWITRKGAVSAQLGEYGIIPGAMGRKSFIVRGKGNADSFNSCSHGAGRAMSRGAAKRRFTVDDHIAATAGLECRKDSGVIDETPAAYKSIDAVMAAQADLVEIVHTLRAVLCIKG